MLSKLRYLLGKSARTLFDALRHIVLRGIDQRGDRIGFHLFGRIGLQQSGEILEVAVAGIEPNVFMFLRQDYRHPIVDGLNKFIGLGSNDRERMKLVSLRFIPRIPQARECKRLTALENESQRELGLFTGYLTPLEEAVG